MTEFSLRALAWEVWDEPGDWDSASLADEIRRRIAAGDRDAALAQLLPEYGRRFVAARRKFTVPLRERLERHTEQVGECLLWTLKTERSGYGTMTIHDARHGHKTRLVHRVAYEAFVGPIPEGYDIDHWCHSRDPGACVRPCIHIRCWNPEHLRAMSKSEHASLRRGETRQRKAA